MLRHIPGSFLGIELSLYALFAWALYTSRSSRRDVMTLLAACLFGFCIEYLFAAPELPAWLVWLIGGGKSESGDSYTYGQFLVMIAGVVPLWVALGWGCIICAAMRTTKALGFSPLLAPLANGLLAASVDFSLDPVAEATGYWSWKMWGTLPGLRTAFGIPLDNFLGWMMIVGSFSLMSSGAFWLASKWGSRLWVEVLCLAVALVAALALAMGIQNVFNWLYLRVTPAGAFLLVYGAALVLTVSRLPSLRRDAPPDPWTLTFIGYFHAYLLVMFFSHRVYDAHPALLPFLPLLAVSSWVAYAWPSLSTLLGQRNLVPVMPAPGDPAVVPARPAP